MHTHQQDAVAVVLEHDCTYQVNMSAMIQGWHNGIVQQERVGTVRSWLVASALRKQGLVMRNGIAVTMFRRVK